MTPGIELCQRAAKVCEEMPVPELRLMVELIETWAALDAPKQGIALRLIRELYGVELVRGRAAGRPS